MKTAVVLLNLGGPDDLKNVRPFLFNLFSDPAILTLPAFIRLPLATLISITREKTARVIYKSLGGKSPLFERTQEQARALEQELNSAVAVARSAEQSRQHAFKCFVAMRYWRPRAAAAVQALSAWGAEQVILLPMYPQFSFTTTGSSFRDMQNALEKAGKQQLLVRAVENYPAHPGFIKALAQRIKEPFEKLAQEAEEKKLPAPRLLLSAHGLPKKLADKGDPYAAQCEETVAALVRELNIPKLDYRLCYQSRVGPLEWLKPYTEDEIVQASAQMRPLFIAPIAFTADNSETLYEIDMLYRHEAAKSGVPLFASAPCVGAHPAFIEGLAGLVRAA